MWARRHNLAMRRKKFGFPRVCADNRSRSKGPMQQPSQALRFVAVSFSPDALISALSPGAEQCTGYSARELIGAPITQILADRSVFELPRILESAADEGAWEGDVVFMNRSGENVCLRGYISSLDGDGHGHSGYLLVSTPERSAAPGAKERTALQEAGAKLRTLSHEMNNPLAVMMGFMQLILLNPQCAGKVRADMEKLYSEMNRVVHVLERLHNYALSLQEEPHGGVTDCMAS